MPSPDHGPQTNTAGLRLAATLLLARDGHAGVELCMITRNRAVDFASGATVFPGGGLESGDYTARAVSDGAEGLSDDTLALRVAAIREAFEECGLLLARRGGIFLSAAETTGLVANWRPRLEAGAASIVEMAQAEGLTLAVDTLVPFAHWLTPTFMKKRFDTHFFIARAPDGQALSPDGREAVSAVWITPSQAMVEAREGARKLVFVTWLNLERTAMAKNAADALDQAHMRPVVTVTPTLETSGKTKILRIPAEAGYRSALWRMREITDPPEAISPHS